MRCESVYVLPVHVPVAASMFGPSKTKGRSCHTSGNPLTSGKKRVNNLCQPKMALLSQNW